MIMLILIYLWIIVITQENPQENVIQQCKGNTYTWKVDSTGAVITDSYNEGDILVTAKTDNVTVGGICGLCSSITNTDNHGNITSKHASVYLEGLAFRVTTVVNSNFDGQITTENLPY